MRNIFIAIWGLIFVPIIECWRQEKIRFLNVLTFDFCSDATIMTDVQTSSFERIKSANKKVYTWLKLINKSPHWFRMTVSDVWSRHLHKKCS
jgi:hypothetical protein